MRVIILNAINLVRLKLAFLSVLLLTLFSGCDGGSNYNNVSPVAEAGEDQIVLPFTTVTLDGSHSSDADGQITSYLWEQANIGGTPVNLVDATSPTVSFDAPDPGEKKALVFRLTVTDNAGTSSSDDVTITVNPGPAVDAGADQTITFSGSAPLEIILQGTAIDDGDIATHQWVEVDGDDWTLVDVDNAIDGQSVATFRTNAAPTTGSYTFSYTAVDEDGTQATDTVSVLTLRALFTDAFDDGSQWTARWIPVNDGDPDMDWLLSDEMLLQKGIIIRNFDNSYHLGTYALLSDPPAGNIPKDYRFSVDITPSTNLDDSRQGNDVGIMFRYQEGTDSYYRVWMNSRYGFTRFEKRQGSLFSTLAVNAIGYIENQTINMTAELQGNSIIVWIDGVPVFAIADDNPIPEGTVALYGQDRVLFDNVMITEPSLQPTVAITTPLAYTVALTPVDGDNLTVEAIVLNQPEQSSVTFALDDDTEIPATRYGDVYSAMFTSVADGEHEVAVFLRDAKGKELSSDINSTVGTGGDYYVTVGDSITNGVEDERSWNNESIDGRIVAIQGFQAPLADLLTDVIGRPQIVFNEGIAGDKSLDLSDRIGSILERHPGSSDILMVIGTNDSIPGNPLDPNDYENSVREIKQAIENQNGLRLWLARIPPTFVRDSNPLILDADRNNIIKQFNNRLVQVASDPNDETALGPDFYVEMNETGLFSDYLHPNNAGYQVMAEEWLETLTQ